MDNKFIKDLRQLLSQYPFLTSDEKREALHLLKNHPHTGVIYQIWCLQNSRSYVGSARDLHDRMREHLGNIAGGGISSWLWQDDLKIYGLDSFHVKVLAHAPREELLTREAYWQQVLGAVYSDRSINHPRHLGYSLEQHRQETYDRFAVSGHVDRESDEVGIPLTSFLTKSTRIINRLKAHGFTWTGGES